MRHKNWIIWKEKVEIFSIAIYLIWLDVSDSEYVERSLYYVSFSINDVLYGIFLMQVLVYVFPHLQLQKLLTS